MRYASAGHTRILLVAALLAMAACVAPPPVEFGIYTESFTQLEEATEPVLDVFEEIERDIQRESLSDDEFLPDKAAVLVEDAPIGNTALIRRGMSVVGAYNDILARYAAGETVEALRPQLTALAASGGALAQTFGAPAVGPLTDVAVEGLMLIAGGLGKVADRQAFAEEIQRNEGKVDAFLQSVRGDTGAMFQAARAHGNQRLRLLSKGRTSAGLSELAKQLDADLMNFRVALASWVLALDQAAIASRALEQAVISGADRGLTLQNVVFWTGEIEDYAGRVKVAIGKISNAF